jgi:CheY-like chemotaxis protein
VARARAGAVEVAVEDSGIGIDAAELPRIFEEFYQVGNPARDRRMGVGLGLATVKRLSDLLGLQVSVRSTFGEGSVFSFELPRTSAPASVASSPPVPRDALLAQRRVLVVEDDADSRAALLGLLAGWGCVARAAEDVVSVHQCLADGFRPEAVLADLRLAGGASGIDAVAVVRDMLGAGVPALVVTGDAGSAHARRAEAQGLPVLSKPVRPAALRAFLGQAFASPAEGADNLTLSSDAPPSSSASYGPQSPIGRSRSTT